MQSCLLFFTDGAVLNATSLPAFARKAFLQSLGSLCKVADTPVLVWARQYPVTDAFQEAQVSERSAIQVYQWLRDVCSSQLLQTSIKLGGTWGNSSN